MGKVATMEIANFYIENQTSRLVYGISTNGASVFVY